MFNVILAILVLGVVVFIHEFGHFIIAKANGISVVEFAIGFGPKLIQFKKGETLYCLKLLPFGGSCMMLGDQFLEMEDDDEEDDLDETDTIKEEDRVQIINGETYDMSKAFSNKPVWSRIAAIAAGPIFNFLLAFVCCVFIVSFVGFDPCYVDKVAKDSPADKAGLMAGDKILDVNGNKIDFYRDYAFYSNYHGNEPMNITYERNGEKNTAYIVPEYTKKTVYMMGFSISSECVVASVNKDSASDKAGFKKNDSIKSINGQEVNDSSKLTSMIQSCDGKELVFEVEREGKMITLNATPLMTENESYYVGFASYGQRVQVSPAEAVYYAIKDTGYNIGIVIKSVGMMFNGKVTVDDLSGPVGTVSVISDVVEEAKSDGGFYVFLNLLNLAALISANLGVLNLLPLPALDGGRLVFLLIEAIRGKPVNPKWEGIVHFVGMILLMLLMIYVLFKDIKGLF